MLDTEPITQSIRRQCDETSKRLGAARITALSPDHSVKVISDGHHTIRDVILRPGTMDSFRPERLAAALTAALRGADDAVGKLRAYAYGEVVVNGDSLTSWRKHPHDPAAALYKAFDSLSEE